MPSDAERVAMQLVPGGLGQLWVCVKSTAVVVEICEGGYTVYYSDPPNQRFVAGMKFLSGPHREELGWDFGGYVRGE